MGIDALIVGAGIYGCTVARCLTDLGKKCVIVEKRDHIGGNCYSENISGINVHRYGPHCFHTNNKTVWDFLNRFTQFNNYRHVVKANVSGKVYSLPLNMNTFNQVWGLVTPDEIINKLNQVKIPIHHPNNLEEWMLSQVGEEIYHLFFKGYTEKQWNKSAKDLPASIIKRLPIRLTYDDSYHNAKYQGIPVDGWTTMFERMLEGIEVILGVDFMKEKWDAKQIVYSGEIDKLFDMRFGALEYRSLRFENKVLDGGYQGTAQVNYTGKDVPFTRIVEHKHFHFQDTDKTVVTWEFPCDYNENSTPYYPVRDDKNFAKYLLYKELAKQNGYVIGGRLGNYAYLNIDATVADALKICQKIL